MGRIKLVALCCLLLLVTSSVSFAGQQQQLTVNIANGGPGSLIEFAVNAGKVGEATVDSGGNAMSILDLSNLGKVRVDVYVEVCVDGRTVVRIIQEGETVPEDENCDRRPVGAFLLDDGMRVSLDMQSMTAQVSGGGLSTTTKIIIGAGAGAAAAGAAVGLGGDSETVVPDEPDEPDEPEPPATTNPFQALIGRVFTGQGLRQTDNCNFFTSTSQIQLTINNVNADGSGTLTKVHTNAGVTFNHTINVTESGGTFMVTTNTITVQIGSQTFLSQITEFQISGNTITANQRFTRDLGGPNECHAHYAIQLTSS